MPRQVLNHHDPVIGRHNQGLVAIVEELGPQWIRPLRLVDKMPHHQPDQARQAGCQKQKRQIPLPLRLGLKWRKLTFRNRDWFKRFIVVFLFRCTKPSRKVIRSKERNIFPSRDTDPEVLVFALFLKVLLQPMAELARIVPYDIVLAGAVTGPAAKYANPNLVFADLIGPSSNLAFTHIEQKAGKQGRFGEATARGNALSKLPARIRVQVQDGFPRRMDRLAGAGCGLGVVCLEVWR